MLLVVTLWLDEDQGSESSVSSAPSIDPEDPMYDYLVAKRKEEKARKGTKKAKYKSQTVEERRARKERKKMKKAARGTNGRSERLRAVERLLGHANDSYDESRRAR